jgi:bifunctional DNase/RNase
MMQKAKIAGLTMDPASNTPIIILKTQVNNQAIPIWIGLLEVTSIASALQRVKFNRPMTHDLFKNFTNIINFTVKKVEICDLKNDIFFAKMYFQSDDKSFDMDARPSDAIAIALRFQAPIYVDDKIIEMSKIKEDAYEVFDESEQGKKWADYLKNLAPENFGKYKV